MTDSAKKKPAKAQVKTSKQKSKPTKSEETKMPTIESDQIDMNEAEDFKLPGVGVHPANLAGVELVPTKKNPSKDQFVLTVALSQDDPDAPNLPMRKYLGWPLPEEREVYWGSRTAYGAQVQAIKETMTAFGGKESGAASKNEVLAFLDSKIGMAVKVKVKQEARKDQYTGEPLDPPEFQANVDKLLPA
jgi:hypothetical protein